MPVTVVNESAEGETVVAQTDEPRSFQWGAAFAGAFIAAGVSFLLLTLGSGVGLSLVSVRHATTGGTITFLTLGAVYFLAAQAFGFAAGGHVTGRLIGPALETAREEEFRAGAHGLVVWALTVVATAAMVALAALVTGAAATTGSVTAALANSVPASSRSTDTGQPAVTSYNVDKLFRPEGTEHASLAWRQYAQADTGSVTDATPPPPETSTLPPSDSGAPETNMTTRTPGPVFLNGGTPSTVPGTAATTTTTSATLRSLGADKAEAGRILTVGMADGAQLSSADRARLAQLVAADTGLAYDIALSRVNRFEGEMHDDAVNAAELARKTAAYASLWTALALLFGAIVAVAAAISARWEDDREAGLFPGTRVAETRFTA